MTNPILEELYEARRQLQAEHGQDLKEFLHEGLLETIASGHPVAKIEQKRLRTACEETNQHESTTAR
ncbi:hypothetical protein [Aeoliella sp. SH292]|uniref:hypothetical protein n=1 Tax=Aeoliella sp. SH292 TaxID=3454464 RepID=UPI003F9D5D19